MPHCLRVLDASEGRESEEREDGELRVAALFDRLASDPVKVHAEEKQG